MIKNSLRIILLFIFRRIPFYKINRIVYTDLSYTEYILLQKCKILYFIPIVIQIDKANSIQSSEKLSQWYGKYAKYINNKYNITEKSYYKPLKE